jgi:2-keto-4-pentenoate hydratase/2-oxohepta-3-ene-1,7-dioic acid hydratase in catechol pathway
VRFGSAAGRFVVVRDDAVVDVETQSNGRFASDVRAGLAQWDDVLVWADDIDWTVARPVADVELGPPVPDPRQVFAVALNYRPHAAEAGFEAPESPLVFTKFPSCIAGPVTQVTLPTGKVDWEIELVVVIGRGGRDIDRDAAWEAVAGLTIGQDLSERVLQSAGKPPQFSLGKSHAGFGPTGPVAVTPDEFADRDDIGFECALDGEQMQRGRTSEMIFPVDDLVARLSAVCELFPGDLIFTGTPAGVGNRRNPPRYLQPGETLVSRVDQIGEIRQTFS